MVEALKYLDPLWYFNLKSEKKAGFYFPDYRKLSPEEKLLIDFDPHYKALSLQDAAFQALKRGMLSTYPSASLDPSDANNIPLSDHYRFVRKYYHSGWSLYFFFIRILMLKNPLKEIQAFIQTLPVQRASLYAKVSDQSPEEITLPEKPRISLILPTLNRYEHLKNILEDLSHQTIPASEIIVVDQSDPANKQLYDSFGNLPLTIIYQKEKGQWLARNEAVHNSTGDFILLTDDDSRVQPDWIEQHLKGLLFFKASISAGVSVPEGKMPGKDKTFFRMAEEFDSGNAMVRREVFKQTGLFDRAFDRRRMGDTEFGLRAHLAGLRSISNPLAKRNHVISHTGGMRYWGSKDAFKPIAFFGARPDPGVLYLYRKYFDKKYLFSFLLVRILLSYMPSQTGKNAAGYLAGFIFFILFSPVWIVRLLIGLRKARRMESF